MRNDVAIHVTIKQKRRQMPAFLYDCVGTLVVDFYSGVEYVVVFVCVSSNIYFDVKCFDTGEVSCIKSYGRYNAFIGLESWLDRSGIDHTAW